MVSANLTSEMPKLLKNTSNPTKSLQSDKLLLIAFLSKQVYGKCMLSPPYGYAVHPRYGATYFARRSANGLCNFVAPLSFCSTAKAVRAKGKAPSRNGKLRISSDYHRALALLAPRLLGQDHFALRL